MITIDASTAIDRSDAKIAFIAMAVVAVSLAHFLVPTEPHSYHMVHIALRKLYFLPPVIAGAWFGLRGAAYTTAATSAIFATHAFVDWPGNYMEQANQLGELAGFWVVGLVPGYLFDRQRSLLRRLAKANDDTLLSLVAALDMREKNTRLHSQRVRDYTLLLAEKYGVPKREWTNIAYGALLHDVGKIAVRDDILLKPGKLSPQEWAEMRRHPEEGYKLLQHIDFLRDTAEIVYSHHEHYDGTGYPRGLKGETIPLGARLFMVADVFDALTSERPYHHGESFGQALAEIHEMSGSHFDPAVVQAFSGIDPAALDAIRLRYQVTGPVFT